MAAETKREGAVDSTLVDASNGGGVDAVQGTETRMLLEVGEDQRERES